MPDITKAQAASGMLSPPTPEQEEIYDVCAEDGDLFHVSDVAHVQCQLHGSELWVHDILIKPHARRAGAARGILQAIRAEHPEINIVANGVDWAAESGLFWKAMVEEGVVDRLITYSDGEITAADLAPDQASAPPSP